MIVNDFTNPHHVKLEHIGLHNVDNTSDCIFEGTTAFFPANS